VPLFYGQEEKCTYRKGEEKWLYITELFPQITKQKKKKQVKITELIGCFGFFFFNQENLLWLLLRGGCLDIDSGRNFKSC
jgi:hypothetical protein